MASMLGSTGDGAMGAPTGVGGPASPQHDETIGKTGATTSAAHEHNDDCSSEIEITQDTTKRRKVVSHIFGRNKACTSQIPERFFAVFARAEYQRFRYKAGSNWPFEQIKLVRIQVDQMEVWGAVKSWAIELQASKRKQIKQEDSKSAQSSADSGRNPPRCAERFLLPYLGKNKTFADIKHVLDVIEANLRGKAKAERIFPGVEFLPNIDKTLQPPKTWPMKPRKEKVKPISTLDPKIVSKVKQWLREKKAYEKLIMGALA